MINALDWMQPFIPLLLISTKLCIRYRLRILPCTGIQVAIRSGVSRAVREATLRIVSSHNILAPRS